MPKQVWTPQRVDLLRQYYYEKPVTELMQLFCCTERAIINRMYRLKQEDNTLPAKKIIKHAPIVYLRIDPRTVVTCKPTKVRQVKQLFGIA